MTGRSIETTSIITSRKLSAIQGLIHGCSTRETQVNDDPFHRNMSFKVGDDPERVKRNRAFFLKAIHFDGNEFATAGQCHSTYVTEATENKPYDQCDALITNRKGILLSVSTADCAPILICEPVVNVVATIHSGWKGTANSIVHTTVERLVHLYQAIPRNIIAFVGPCAKACCYEIGTNVASSFDDSVIERRDGKLFLRLEHAIENQLKACGIPAEHIETNHECTICNRTFHSWRRDKERSGRMYSAIGLRRE
jgi:hypothetical protein